MGSCHHVWIQLGLFISIRLLILGIASSFFLSFFWFVLVCVSLLKYKSFIQSQSQHFITSYIQLGLAFILLLLLSFHPPFMFVFILFFHFFYRYRKLCTLKHVLFLLHKISILYLLNSTLPSLLLSQRL